MAQFALFVGGEFQETRHYDERPDHIPHKDVAWYPVGTQADGDPARWEIVGDEAVQFIPAQPSPPAYNALLKTDIWLRMSDAEAAKAQAALEGMKSSASRLYRLFSDATEIRNDTDFYPQLHGVFVKLYGEARATELLGVTRYAGR